MVIEPVTPKNIAYVVGLGRELQQMGSLNDVLFDWDYTLRSTARAAADPDYYIRVAMDEDATYCGFVGGHMTPFFFSPRMMGVEDAWFVRPLTKQRTKIAVTLMRGLVTWALDTKGGVMLQSGDIASIDTVAVDSIYRHIGFRRYGTIYKYERGLDHGR